MTLHSLATSMLHVHNLQQECVMQSMPFLDTANVDFDFLSRLRVLEKEKLGDGRGGAVS